MKSNILFIAMLALFMASCAQSGQKQETHASNTDTFVFDADTLYSVAESYVNQPITVKGHMTHACSHSGRRCFITGEGQKYSIRVEALDEIGRFDQEQVGTLVAIDGILRERRLTRIEIAEMEEDVNQRMQEEEGEVESCEAELANINEMKKWMEAQGKDFYSIYYIDGLKYHDSTN